MIDYLTTVIICVNLGVSLMGIVALIISILAYLKAASIEKSTHTVQFMPTEEAVREWGTSDKEVDKINNANKDDLDTDFSSLSI